MISQIFLDDDDLTETVHLGRERQRRAKQCSSLKFFIYKQQLLIWSFWVVAILMAEFRWKLSFQPGLSQPVSPTTANSYRSITFGLFRHRQSLFFQLCWDCCYRRLCWCHSWGGGLFPETDLSIVSAQRQRRKNSVTANGNHFVIIKTFQTKFRFYTWWQTGATCQPFPQLFPQWDFKMLEKSINRFTLDDS